MGLWNKLDRRKRPSRSVNNSAAARGKRAESKAREGHARKAVAALEGGSLAEPGPRTLAALAGKHPDPVKPIPSTPREKLPSAKVERISERMVETAVRSFAKGTAGRGLRAQHLVDALNSPAKAQHLTILTRYVRFLADGEALVAVSPFLGGASLTALDQSKGGKFDVRPIASGEITRRLVSKCLCAVEKESAASLFVPGGQYGVACKSGTERVVHNTRRVVAAKLAQLSESKDASDPDLNNPNPNNNPNINNKKQNKNIDMNISLGSDFVILKVDLRNAFNCVSRAEILKLVQTKFPHLSRWVHWIYGGEAPLLWFGSDVLRSKEGVQQGDPLGPLLFAMVIQSLVDAIRAKCPNLELNKWYLDDGVLAGPEADVLEAFKLIQSLGPAMGMELNIKKNELIKFSDLPDGFPKECERHFVNFDLLGAPIGDAVYCAEYMKTYTAKRVERLLAALGTLRDPQVVHFLVKCCASMCKVVHLLRTVPPHLCSQPLQDFDQKLRSAYSKGVGVLFGEAAWNQLVLPGGFGGAGLRQASAHASAAYVASASACAKADSWSVSEAEGWSAAVDDLVSRTECTHEQLVETLSNQKTLSAYVDEALWNALYTSSSSKDKARLWSVRATSAASWLSVVPSEVLNLTFDPNEFTTLLRFWTGMPVDTDSCLCPWCKTTRQDAFGYHALVCKSTGLKVLRHNALREVFLRYCKMANVAADRETPNLLPGSNDRPADVLLENPEQLARLTLPNYDGNRPVCLDFAVTHPLQTKTLNRAGVSQGAAADDYADSVKVDRYEAKCDVENLSFVPMVVEVFGAWGKRARPVLEFLARAVAFNKSIDQDRASVFLGQALSVTLQRHNVRALPRHRNPDNPHIEDDAVPVV